jgi:predicted TIM-barrel fold metal-dependent hydrolase
MIDCHANIIVDGEKYINELPFTIENYLKEMDDAKIEMAVIMINPNIKEIFCKKGHKIKCFDSNINGEILIECRNCKKIIYKGENPYRDLNVSLINQCKKYTRRLFPLVYLPVLPKLSQFEYEYYENKHKGEFFGYKFQPSLSNNKISILKNFNSNLPILIHSGRDEISNPINIIEFAKRYNGNIVISHFSKFNQSIFDFANTNQNIYIDSSPASIMFKAISNSPEKLFNIEYLADIKRPQELYRNVLTTLDEDKLLFGSDYPVSSIKKEKSILESSNLSKKQINKISHLNIIKAFSLNKF